MSFKGAPKPRNWYLCELKRECPNFVPHKSTVGLFGCLLISNDQSVFSQALARQAPVTQFCGWGPGLSGQGLRLWSRWWRGVQEPELTHIGAFSLGQLRAVSGLLQSTDRKHTGRQQRETEGDWPQHCLTSAHTQTETSCKRQPLHKNTQSTKGQWKPHNTNCNNFHILALAFASCVKKRKKNPTTQEFRSDYKTTGHCFFFSSITDRMMIFT